MTAVELGLVLIGMAALVFCSALFSGLETALFSLRPHQLDRLAQSHPALGNFVALFRDKPRRVFNVLLLGDGLIKVPLVTLCLFLIWEGPLAARFPQWLTAVAIFALVVVLCDLLPKLIAMSAPFRLSTLGALVLQTSVPVLDRAGRTLERASSSVVDFLTPAPFRARSRLSDEELETLVEMGEEEGTLRETEGEIIQEIIKLGDKTVKDCMTPRVETFALADDLTIEDAIVQLKARRHRRVPVYADTPDNIVGIIDVKRFLMDPSEHYTETLLAPSFMPETMRALDLLKLFLTHPQGLAIVVDEFGGTEGIITMTDIVDEMLSDAAPRADADLYIETLENGKFLVSGRARLDDISEHLGFDLEADGIDTIGGLIFNRLGYLPPPGTQMELARLAITVRRTSKKRIEELLLEKTSGAEQTEEQVA
jgi:putative hemolysin